MTRIDGFDEGVPGASAQEPFEEGRPMILSRQRSARLIPKVFLGVLLCLASIATGCIGVAPAAKASWPASATGRPAFYYFGTPG